MRLKFALEAENQALQEKLKHSLFCPGAFCDPEGERVFRFLTGLSNNQFVALVEFMEPTIPSSYLRCGSEWQLHKVSFAVTLGRPRGFAYEYVRVLLQLHLALNLKDELLCLLVWTKLDITDISHNNYLDTTFGKGVQQHQRTCAVCVDYQQNIIMQNVIMNHWRASCLVTFEDVTYTMYSTQHSKYFFCCLMAEVEQKSTTIPPRSLFQSKLRKTRNRSVPGPNRIPYLL